MATNRARELFEEGLVLYGAERFHEAHAAFVAAWSLKKHHQIAGMLGDCEMRVGKYRDAAEHLTYYVREYPKGRPTAKVQRARELLDEAKRHVGTLVIRVDEPGVDVLVDGKPVGQSPLVDPVFVDPGSRLVEAQRGPAAKLQTVEVSAGSTYTVRLVLTAPPASPVPEPAPTNWKAITSGVLTAAGIGAGIGLLARANIIGAETNALRAKSGITTDTTCINPEQSLRAACADVHAKAVQQIPYFWGGVGALALAAGSGVATFLFLRPSGKSAAPRVGVGISPGPYLQIHGSF
ncbi:hypothetical protein [Polyangium sorediatum]|uniref:PEGA domain-containing protein n=1 Tax=Polyangium sorediatum TaxID=889274 RepID=A0ABT6NPM0_9BACT|nr:hypothetical protein [Polyangium sorediatum]MDI1430157.1 hypothetical protein [Polyangium sorediatum]